jgi:hypothetical protein
MISFNAPRRRCGFIVRLLPPKRWPELGPARDMSKRCGVECWASLRISVPSSLVTDSSECAGTSCELRSTSKLSCKSKTVTHERGISDPCTRNSDASMRGRTSVERGVRITEREEVPQCWSAGHRFGVSFELRRRIEPLRWAVDHYLRSVPRFLRARSATTLSAIIAPTSTTITLSKKTLRTTIGLAHFFSHR